MEISKFLLAVIACVSLAACDESEAGDVRLQSQSLAQSEFEKILVEQSGKPIEQLRSEMRSNAAIERAEVEARRQREAEKPEPPAEIQCSVTSESSPLSPQERAELEAELARTSVTPLAPGVREVGEPPSVEELRQPPVAFEARVPSDEVLERQREFFAGRQQVTPDLSNYRGEQRANISREIERSRGMSPVEMLLAVEDGDISFEAVEAVANAESNRDDRSQKYEVLLRDQ